MTDRIVQIVSANPPLANSEHLRTFSDFYQFRNVILLGDPGAGKSHLFRYARGQESGKLLTARSYLNRPIEPGQEVLFVDALDEKRSGRGDHATVDEIVKRLFATKAQKIRISCRAQDWLGDTDLAALRNYFDDNGGCVVLSLSSLSKEEGDNIIASKLIADTKGFREEAATRGLDYLLTNPQNLLMLCEVVKSSGWPTTKFDLFSRMAQILLSEHNEVKSKSGEGVYRSAELLDAAGAICAARLISDVEAISRSDSEGSDETPSYRSIHCEDIARVSAALSRRLFVATASSEAVDYVHRTIAEFLAASWLAKRVRQGLPFGRVRALISVDGHPTSELRGLHAWLAAHLPEHAEVMLQSDPYGILTYGDIVSLPPKSKKILLRSLADLSQSDPWFRYGAWSIPALGALSTSDMESELRAILQSKNANFSLKSCALEALTFGAPLKSLQPDLELVILDPVATFSERSNALNAVARFEPDGVDFLVGCFKRLGNDVPALRLRARILSKFFHDHFGVDDVKNFVKEILASKEELPIGTLGDLDSVPRADAMAILDEIPAVAEEARRNKQRRNSAEISYLVDQLITRILQNGADEVSGRRLWSWLSARPLLREDYSSVFNSDVKTALGANYPLLIQTIQPAVEELVIDEDRWRFMHRFREATLSLIEHLDLLEAMALATESSADTTKQDVLFELTLILSFHPEPRALAVFERLASLATTRPGLREIFDRNLSCPLEEWREEDAVRRARNIAEKKEARSTNVENFNQNRHSIERGAHNGWMAWLARVYLAHFRDVDKSLSPRERIAREVGSENESTAMDGLLAVIYRDDVPSLREAVETLSGDQYYEWWLAIIASLDEHSSQGNALDQVSVETFQSALIIGLSTFTFNDKADNRRVWKTDFIRSHPKKAADAYLELLKADLALGKQHLLSLHPLVSDDILSEYRRDIVLEVLEAFPNSSFQVLENLLQKAIETSDTRQRLLSLAGSVLTGSLELGSEQRMLWLATAFLLDPERRREDVEALGKPMVWAIRDLSGNDRRSRMKHAMNLEVGQLSFIAVLAAKYFSSCDFPDDGLSGSQNPWDGAEFARSIINQISGIPTPEATRALEAFLLNPIFVTYDDFLKHALSNQKARRREIEYIQPDWSQTIHALSNGAPASAADLQALLVDHLTDLNVRIGGNNADLFKQFWNEDSYGRPVSPKVEETCRDVLMNLARPQLAPLGIALEPEGHMVTDKRADMVALAKGPIKAVVEIKRDTHPDVWTAATGQLDRLYARDSDTSGYGIYAVFWFGPKRSGDIALAPNGRRPQSANEMRLMLNETLSADLRKRIHVLVFDLSGSA